MIRLLNLKIFFKDKDINLKTPIFITGMPRSGTTLLTHILHDTKKYGSFLYKDYPFPELPLFWNKFNDLYYKSGKDQKRIHNDDLLVNKNSPENLDEFIWKRLFQNHYKEFDSFLDGDFSNPEFENNYIRSIKKVLFVRKKNQYLSKNNYIIFIIKYLLKFITSDKFIVCIRNPNDTCYSLEKIHKRFIEVNKIREYKNFEKIFYIMNLVILEEIQRYLMRAKKLIVFGKRIKNLKDICYSGYRFMNL